MPLYSFRCHCGNDFEARRAIDERTAPCPECDAECERRISAPPVRFDGGGWAADGYASKGGDA